jgi:lipoate-protein ligase B
MRSELFSILDLGLIDYAVALGTQKAIFADVKSGRRKSTLVVCRHNPVITLGRQANKNNILAGKEELKKRGIEIFEIERGGDITYHGPGQLTAYPIFNLNDFKKDIHFFLRQLEEAAIGLLFDFGVTGTRKPGFTGVWAGDKKIASIGIAISSWVTFHGISININNDDLANFSLIRPCGMDIEMISLETLLGRRVESDTARPVLIEKFINVFSGSREEAILA